jgi:hypothetical protein
MPNELITPLIAGYYTVFAAVIGSVLTFFFLTVKEYINRKNNRIQLIFELLALSSSLKAMRDAAQCENKIETPFELGQVAIVLKRYDTRKKLSQLQDLLTKSIIFDIENAQLFAEFLGTILRIVVLIEQIEDLNKSANFQDQKLKLVSDIDSILEKIQAINNKLLLIKFYNESSMISEKKNEEITIPWHYILIVSIWGFFIIVLAFFVNISIKGISDILSQCLLIDTAILAILFAVVTIQRKGVNLFSEIESIRKPFKLSLSTAILGLLGSLSAYSFSIIGTESNLTLVTNPFLLSLVQPPGFGLFCLFAIGTFFTFFSLCIFAIVGDCVLKFTMK